MENIKVCKNCGSLENAYAERCSKCNAFIGDYGNDNFNSAPQPQFNNFAPQQPQPPMQPPMQPQPQQPMFVENNYPDDDREEVLSIGKYIMLFILGCFPLINLICWIIWLVDSSTNRNIKNFIKAQLILFAIVVVLGIVGVLIFGAGLSMLF